MLEFRALSVRFGAVTDRHRGHSKDESVEDETDGRSSRGKWIGIITGAFVVPVILATITAFALRDEPSPERPESAGDTQQVAPTASPKGEPTYGEYVPPDADPQVATKPPRRTPTPMATSRKRPPPGSSPTSRTRGACPPGWDDVWWLRAWCQRHGYGGR